jgi:hypothetical protein
LAVCGFQSPAELPRTSHKRRVRATGSPTGDFQGPIKGAPDIPLGAGIVIRLSMTRKSDGESRAIDLRGAGQRSLRRVDFWYDTAGLFHGKADVTLFGMK